ncbi:ATP-binding cassette domain-containing protein [Shewanella mesophila]|uniref:ATP-binding cassette domain-containing protein n=1 Tax=Shewanella mesophila TaxID=2864208 RepID=UPI001C658934|nr:ATP-binding cassette domain-containing protein [Shewanella mesophila]QYJ86650.1 ATP-binding cassette domain-containing protein [Shewanella mesophila]
MLTVEGLSIQADAVSLLSPLSFSLKQGEVLGVIGASGSGKSLLAQALMGQVPPGFRLGGKIRCRQGARRALAAQSASVLDPLRLIGSQLRYAAQRRSTGSSARRHYFKLAHDISSRYRHQLSGGMAKRALMAQACWQSSEIMIADEPCCGLDVEAAKVIYQHLATLARDEQLGVMVISHNLRQLLPIADRVLVLRDGHLVEMTTPAHIRAGTCDEYTRRFWMALPEHWEVEGAAVA